MPEKTSLRQEYKAAFRLLNLVRRIDASILPQKILLAMLQAWTPYISLFFTAQPCSRCVRIGCLGGCLALGFQLRPRNAEGLSRLQEDSPGRFDQ